MNELELMFYGDSTGQVINESNRTMTLDNGVQIMLPTRGDSATATGSRPGTSVDSPSLTNSTYDDLLAIWDAYNGGSTSGSGAPPRWAVNGYWSASPSTVNNSHHYTSLIDGQVGTLLDSNALFVAFQVL
jgi:hypothetical protein